MEDRSSWRIGNGRGATPDGNDVFKQNSQLGSVEICDTGFGIGRKPTPEENQERIFKLETDVERIDKDVSQLKQNNMNLLD